MSNLWALCLTAASTFCSSYGPWAPGSLGLQHWPGSNHSADSAEMALCLPAKWMDLEAECVEFNLGHIYLCTSGLSFPHLLSRVLIGMMSWICEND